MTQRPNPAAPIMRSRTGLERHRATPLSREIGQNLPPRQTLALQDRSITTRRVNLKNLLCKIYSNNANL